MKKLAFLFFILLSANCFAQFSKTHYIPPLTAQNNLPEEQYLYISTPNTNNVNFKIIEIGGNIISGVVSNNSPYTFYIGQGNATQLFTSKDNIGIIQNKGYIIEAEDLVYASVRVTAAKNIQNGISSYVHAGGLVSKGNSALGNTFRLGAMLNPLFDGTLLNFASILSTENNTRITISNIPIGTIFSDGTTYTGPIVKTLNKNESYVIALENINDGNPISNSSKMIGALVESDKPVVVNSGSFGGSNSTAINAQGNPAGRDIGFDQIVSQEKTGKEYIFVKGIGTDELERVLLIANTPNAIIYINGNANPFATLTNAGDNIVIDGSKFIDGNLYVTTSENVFAYQSIGGLAPSFLPNGNPNNPPANQNLFFVPPINCATPKTVNNIPLIDKIGNISYNGGLNIVTETGALVKINDVNIAVNPIPITGTPNFVRYTINGLYGNVSVKSTKQVYVSYFGTNGYATYGGYYSGFDLKPEIVSDKISVINSSCIPNVVLKISTLSSYDTFQWYENDVEIPGAIDSQYTPTIPGYYQVRGSISNCGSTVFSDKIPVSECPTNLDNDLANDNIDLDNDNDGITNCTESYGDQNIDISNTNTGNIVVGNYSNSYTGAVTTSPTASVIPFTGNADGSFVSEVPAGKGNSITYTINFNQPISLGIEYVSTANPSDLLNAEAEYVINSPINKTITVLNPDNQLLIDTNYDGIYETGITEFSSFEIRFRLNNTIPLAAGTGTFRFLTYLSNSIRFTHKNLSEDNPNKSTLKFFAACVPKDSDNDGISDQLDNDSDDDGISDTIEAQNNNSVTLSNSDINYNGIDDAFEPGFSPVDTDNDGIQDYLDLDGDNDGILDSVETEIDTDTDAIKNYRDLDSDNDLCYDVVEAGFLDPNGDGFLGNNPVIVDSKGQVTSGIGYLSPNVNYTTPAPIIITTQPSVIPTCELENATISVADNGGNTYQWQLSTDGTTWNDILDNSTYSGATTQTLLITAVSSTMEGYKYRVQLNKVGNSCGLTSAETILTIYALPIVNDITIIQCDDDLDAVTSFNLTVKNDVISGNYTNETFSYYTTFDGAKTADTNALIANLLSFTNTTPGIMPVWARVVNKNGCFSVSKITLQVLATQIPINFKRYFEECDDFLDINGNNNTNNDKRDGVSSFNFSSVTNDIKAMLPAGNYTITYYRNEADALAELNVITDISNYRNIGYPNSQQIWGRVDSDVDNACYGLGPYVDLKVETLPFANPVVIPRQCDDNHDGIFTFDTANLESTLLNGQSNVAVTYFDETNTPLPSPFPATFTTKSQIIKAVVTNNTPLKCFDETSIQFIVDDLPEAFAVPSSLTTTCDDESDPLTQDGFYSFDTSIFLNTIIGTQTGVNVYYYDENNVLIPNSIPNQLPNPFRTRTQNVKVIVENPINTNCIASIEIPFIVNPLPMINLNLDGNEDKLVCQNNPTFFVQLDAGIQDGSPTSNYTYVWFKDGTILPGKISYTLDVNEEGIYDIEVTNAFGCSSIRTIKVTASDVAHIQNIDIVDMTDVNTVTVNVIGLGDYEYSLDEPFGPFQDSNFFNYVTAGIHDVYINDKNGCGTVSKTIAVVGVPKFFTPNNDGYNDYWNVKGVNANFNANSIIYIFDRYGKLLKQVNPTGEGWDGTFNGMPLSADDYWYTIKLEDGRTAKGHFSLKR